ncbi:MAG: hypothetical protein RI885_1677 [Actinomycetota bacterium]|jgi:hypothetical protein
MPDSPISATPYEVLGVASSASTDELRRAYRRMLRETHPDTGGDATRFQAVQKAWERVGTPTARADFDRTGPRSAGDPGETGHSWATPASRPRQDTRPKARAYGHPGGWRRERYLALIREWVGRGEEIPDPYDPALVRRAPREIRHILADAIAEEATARTLAGLGIGYTVWHDVATGAPGAPDEKIDHVVLGPTGLFAVLSEDYGSAVRTRRGELVGEGVGDDRPFHDLARRAKTLTRSLRIRFTALVIVLPDDAIDSSLLEVGSVRGAATIAVRASFLPAFLRDGPAGGALVSGNDLFDVRTRLQSGIRLIG